jgi:D-beta-D-heptose 7-phosphate kinase/D-beta-D-heptose 1-phosphate adenosyltransferase
MSEEKVLSEKEILKKISDIGHKKITGFTNGCFDLLHEGHLHLIREAKKRCDFLIIGLNSDESVKMLKGENRPIENQEQRAKNLSKMEEVDAIAIFNTETPENIIKDLNPDILIKGGDYNKTDIVGSKFVIENGGSVEVIDLLPGFSTTKIINERMK